ncbi:DNA-binding protein, partial [Bacteroides intestinalis]
LVTGVKCVLYKPETTNSDNSGGGNSGGGDGGIEDDPLG